MSPLDRRTQCAHLASGPIEYRLEQRADDLVVLILHGGHLRAGIALGETVFADMGATILAPSRPGYGRTPVAAGGSTVDFADALGELCAHLRIRRVAAAVGVSAGGPTAVALAARHPELVQRLVLVSSVGPLPWPDRATRIAARALFHPRTERATWSAVRLLARAAPGTCLRLLLGPLSLRPTRELVAGLAPADRDEVLALFRAMRSGAGFLNDLKDTPNLAPQVAVPTLVVASPNDASVPFQHAAALVGAISQSELIRSRADSHLVWFSPDWPRIASRIRQFLEEAPGDCGS